MERNLPTGREWLRQRLHGLALLRERRAVTALAALAGLFLLISLAIRAPGLQELDLRITHALQSGRDPALDRLAIALTTSGNGSSVILVMGAAGLLLWVMSRRVAALFCPLAVLTIPLNMGIKLVFGRARPDPGTVEVILPALGLSYPSGHAMGAVVVYGFLALMAWVHIRPRALRILGTVLPVLLALGISVSRIYLGAHWFSDVVGGWTAGLFLLLLLAEAYKRVGRAELSPPSLSAGGLEAGG